MRYKWLVGVFVAAQASMANANSENYITDAPNAGIKISANTSAPVYAPDKWTYAGDVDDLYDNFWHQQGYVLDQIRVWHFGSNSFQGIARTLHEYKDDEIAAKLRLDVEAVKTFRKDFNSVIGHLQFRTNCYAYALNDATGHPAGWAQEPGEHSGYERISSDTYNNAIVNFTNRAQADGLIPAGKDAGYLEGHYRVALFLKRSNGKTGESYDFHWVREDYDGSWSQKLGHNAPTNRDMAGKIITDPRTANLGDYNFVSFFYVPENGLDVGVNEQATEIVKRDIKTRGLTIETTSGEIVNLPQCTDSAGDVVNYSFDEDRDQFSASRALARAFYTPMRGAVTRMSPVLLQTSGKFITFLAEHECAHHSLGHAREEFDRQSTQGSYVSISGTEHHQMELQADCEAIRNMSGRGELDAAGITKIFDNFPPNEHSTDHPPTSLRRANATQCLSEGPEDPVFALR